jgi:hypothetical protein
VPTIFQQSRTKSFHPGLINSTSEHHIGFETSPRACAPLLLRRGDQVLHEHWGRGRVLDAASFSNGDVTIWFEDGQRRVSPNTLRRLLPRTALAQLIARSTPNVSAWMVRKADEQGAIEPDIKGRFAGHAAHYYDEARIPLLIEQLSGQDSWTIGSMVIHDEYGPGRVVGWESRNSGPTLDRMRLVQFFGHSSPVVVAIPQLRRLLASSVVANRLGLNRKTFAKLARRKGVCPDHVTDGSRLREFYDEGRIEDIRQRWAVSERLDSFPPGCLVLDRGQLATVEFRDARGRLHIRYLHSSSPVQPADAASLRKLVSLRELARGERMSRYKLNRLLTAAGVRPVHRGRQVLYFDGNEARKAVHDRLDRERSAVSLGTLADRTGVSAAVLARKVRQGCISTMEKATHAIDASEAERIGEVVRRLHSHRESLEGLGICRLHSRGRTGVEVAGWDIYRLIKVAEPMTPAQRSRLFGQVAWLCEGAGRSRFLHALKCYILSSYTSLVDDRNRTGDAQILLSVLGHLSMEFAPYRTRVALLASGASQIYGATDELRSLARAAGLHTETSYGRLRAQIDESIADLLTCERIQLRLGTSEPFTRRNGSLYPEDDFVRGAIIICINDQKVEVGLIVRVEQQAWNAVVRGWEKTVVVRFAQEERRISPYMRTNNAQQSTPRVMVLLRAADTMAVLHRMRDRLQAERGTGQFLRPIEREAS